MKKYAAGCVVFAVALWLGGCNSHPETAATHQKDPNVVYVKESDAEMNAAIATARATLPQFLAALRAPRKSQETFIVKKRFSYGKSGKSGEHMWVGHLRYDGKLLHGVLDDVPVDVKTVKQGDAVTVAPSELSDWMFLDGGKLIGGTTIRVLYQRLSPDEKKTFQRDNGFRID